jgi:hypothetical protein
MKEQSPAALGDLLSSAGGSTVNASALQITDSAGVIRVTMGALGNGDYGLKIVSSDGSTVIIDGTSDMFRIAASGSLNATALATNTAVASATLSGLGALASTPAHQCFMGASAAATSVRRGPWYWTGVYTAASWAAATSGGATTLQTQLTTGWIFGDCVLDGSSFAVISINIYNYGNVIANTSYMRYYVLSQTAI